jgi:hypothetical protein
MKKRALVGGLAALAGFAMAAGTATAAVTTFQYGGYVKMDVLSTYYNHGDVDPYSPLRDFHLPSHIPVGDSDENYDLDFHVKESRFHLGTTTVVDDREIHGFVELDFLLSKQGDERISNSFNPRLRHFYFQTGRWLLGQTWTTFMIVILPDDLDFIGAADGVVFGRQPQVRFTHGPWQLSLENPETIVTPFEGGTGVVTESGRVPDAVARYNLAVDWGTLGLAAIGRQLHYENGTGNCDREFGFGGSIGGKFEVGKRDDLRFQATAGRGLGRYVALNYTNAAAVDADGKLDAIGQFAAFASYRHFWNETLRSSVNASFFIGDNNANLTGGEVNKEAQSYSINLLYSPVSVLTVGAELTHARRVIEDGTDGSFQRLQFSARYDFGWTPD